MLELWDARTFLGLMSEGQSRPLQIMCCCEEGKVPGNQERFVVKTPDNPTIRESDLFRDAFGCCLARYFGVPTPEPAVIRLTSGFVAVANKSLAQHRLQLRPGYGYGTKFFTSGYGAVRIKDGEIIEAETISQASLIYGFDLLVMNGDRKPSNPNCAQLRADLIAYDFGLAFSQVGKLRACEFDKTNAASTHLFYECLRKRQIDWSAFIVKLSCLTRNVLEEMTKTFPRQWLTLQEEIFEYILEAGENADRFGIVLQESLV